MTAGGRTGVQKHVREGSRVWRHGITVRWAGCSQTQKRVYKASEERSGGSEAAWELRRTRPFRVAIFGYK